MAPRKPTQEQNEARFWSHIKRGAGCWPWQASTFGNGRGQFVAGGKHFPAHRYAFLISKGPIPPGKEVCHSCDNPICCNPAHLWVGTHHENMLDAQAKKRLKGARGMVTKNMQLTPKHVLEIRKIYAARTAPKWGVNELAKKYGVTRTTIARAATGKAWAYLKEGSHEDAKE